MRRPNLTVETGALVSRIVIEAIAPSASNIAAAAALHRAGHREVLLAGGVINSPHVLMLSGIGNPDALAPPASSRKWRCRASGRTCRITSRR
jgi:choline dehydrogenase-like flavoprotein